ncbi:MAG TPA: type II secretion system F family protein [Stellaceae bacterium]|nr:type II secretion system F family protein [Stellaceae bacterium]
MPRFRYRALRPVGGEIEGELVADDAGAAASHLQSAGSFPIEIAPISGVAARARGNRRRRRLPQRELILFTRQLAALLAAGVALDRALHLVAGEHGRSRRALLAEALRAAVHRGESLSRAAVEHNAFIPAHAMVIAAGEARGDLAGALERLAAVLERNRTIRQSLIGALIYPASVLVVACLSVSFLLGFVVPRFATLLEGFRREPPLLMQGLLDVSYLVHDYGALAAAVVFALAALYVFKRRDAAFRIAVDRRLLALPAVGTLVRKIETERLAFLLGTMIAAGVAVPAAVAAARAAATNAALREGLGEAERAIERGDGVAQALAAPRLLPVLTLELVRVGEETGDLAPMLLKASDMLRQEIEATANEWVALVAPLSIVVLGLIIGAIALAIFSTVLEVYDVAT